MKNEKNLSRRDFLKTSSAAAGLGLAGTSGLGRAVYGEDKSRDKKDRLPREVWVASVSLEGLEADTPEEMIDLVLNRMERTAPYEPDIVCLPEIFPYMNISKAPLAAACAEVPPGPVSKRLAEYARKHRCYVICPIYTKETNRIYNAAVLIDRNGSVVGEYRKIRPTVGELEQGVSPGPLKSPVFDTDFGRIGIQICFDVNWFEGWRQLNQSGAEIIFWPSAFPGGRMLNAFAWQHQCYIVTSTRPDPSRIIDMTGEELAGSGRFQHWVCAPVNLEKAFLEIWPYVKKFDAIQAKYGRKLHIETFGHEDWATIASLAPDIKEATVLQEFGIITHKEHIRQAQEMQHKYRM